jgi:CubicO group peptidase (beta-lactamase class C family)
MSGIKLLVHLILSLILVCFLLAATASSQVKSSDEVARKIDEFVNALGKLGPFSGSILIARDGRVLFSKGYGMANLEHDVANTQTKFRIGSVTKPFTATAIMLLQERGKLNVQDPVCKYLSPCPETWQKVTIHHLLIAYFKHSKQHGI